MVVTAGAIRCNRDEQLYTQEWRAVVGRTVGVRRGRERRSHSLGHIHCVQRGSNVACNAEEDE